MDDMSPRMAPVIPIRPGERTIAVPTPLYSPLYSPNGSGAIDSLTRRVARYLYLSEDGILAFYTLIGAMAANMIQGDPCWVVLCGPPSCGKSELINLLLDIAGVFEAASPTGDQAFLSATGKKDKAQDATGGLLRMVGDHGAILMNDLTSLLSKSEADAKSILACLRECYSGRWSRPVGAEGGRIISWEGKLAFFGGCTGIIDRHHELMQSMGERWLYFRMDDDEKTQTSKALKAMENSVKGEWREELRRTVSLFFESLELCFNPLDGVLGDSRLLNHVEYNRLEIIGGVSARCRSATSRDRFHQTDILTPPVREAQARIATALGQLLVGLEAVGVPEAMHWRLIGRVALDSMPASRRICLRTLWRREQEGMYASVADCVAATLMSDRPIERTLKDLESFGCIDSIPEIHGTRWRISEWMRVQLGVGWGDNWGEQL